MSQATKTTETVKNSSDADYSDVPGNVAEQALQIPIDILHAVSEGIVGIFDSVRGNSAGNAK